MIPTRLAVLALLAVACKGGEGDPCRQTDHCAEGLVCLHWEDSDEGACFPESCAEGWTGYGCDVGDTG